MAVSTDQSAGGRGGTGRKSSPVYVGVNRAILKNICGVPPAEVGVTAKRQGVGLVGGGSP